MKTIISSVLFSIALISCIPDVSEQVKTTNIDTVKIDSAKVDTIKSIGKAIDLPIDTPKVK